MNKKTAPPRVTFEEVLSSLKALMPDLKKSFGVESLGVFGSYARGETKRRSDLDLLVEFHRVPTMFEFVRLDHLLLRSNRPGLLIPDSSGCGGRVHS